MSDTNTVVLTGNLTRDPELRYTPKGVAVANVGLASNRKYRQGDDLKDEACFIDVTVFGSTAEAVAKHLDKGRKVLVEGRLRYHTWETETGQPSVPSWTSLPSASISCRAPARTATAAKTAPMSSTEPSRTIRMIPF